MESDGSDGSGSKDADHKNEEHSTRSVLAALVGNSIELAVKVIAFILTGGLGAGSSAILAEIAHSAGDVTNQGFLALGIKRDQRKADKDFPFGYGKERYFWSTIAAVIVCFLAIGSFGKGIYDLSRHETPVFNLESLLLFVAAALIAGIVFFIALKGIRKDKKNTPLLSYLKKTTDPSGVAVLLEDFVAVIGVGIALLGILLTKATGSHVYDAAASMIIGTLMFTMGAYLIDMNRKFLIGRTHDDIRRHVEAILKAHPKVERSSDVRAIVHGVDEVVVEADIELREEAILKDINGGTKKSFAQIPRNDEQMVNEVTRRISAVIDDLEHHIRTRCPEVTEITIGVEQFKSPLEKREESHESPKASTT